MSHNGEIKSLSGFVQQIAVSTLPWGYWWYVSGWIPTGKDPATIDEKLIAKYDITASEATRWRRKQRGISNIRYYRHGRQFVLFFTKGNHAIWTDEQTKSPLPRWRLLNQLPPWWSHSQGRPRPKVAFTCANRPATLQGNQSPFLSRG